MKVQISKAFGPLDTTVKNPLCALSPYPSWLLYLFMEQDALKKNGTQFTPSGPIIT